MSKKISYLSSQFKVCTIRVCRLESITTNLHLHIYLSLTLTNLVTFFLLPLQGKPLLLTFLPSCHYFFAISPFKDVQATSTSMHVLNWAHCRLSFFSSPFLQLVSHFLLSFCLFVIFLAICLSSRFLFCEGFVAQRFLVLLLVIRWFLVLLLIIHWFLVFVPIVKVLSCSLVSGVVASIFVQ